jgi:predicted ArsR family transcriptional regulator
LSEPLPLDGRRAVLAVLRDSQIDLDARQVAEQVGRHVTTVRHHLDRLVDAGVASRRTEPQRSMRGRPRVLYAATSRREPDDGDGLLAMMLAAQLAQSDDPAGQAESAGRRWGRALIDGSAAWTTSGPAPQENGTVDVATGTTRVLALLDEVGFQPSPRPAHDGTVIELHHCPFRRVAQAHPDVACNLHLGLLRGALEQLDVPVEADRIEPFVTPQLCRAHLRHV